MIALVEQMTESLLRTLENASKHFPKHNMPRTLGAKHLLRTWQAIAVLAKHANVWTRTLLTRVLNTSWVALRGAQLPDVRQYMQHVAMRLLLVQPASAVTQMQAALCDATITKG